jgi:hypothetical protein
MENVPYQFIDGQTHLGVLRGAKGSNPYNSWKS